MDTNTDGKLGYWEEVNPSYTVFNKNSETFSSIWTNYNRIFSQFYDSCTNDINGYSKSTSLKPKPNEPSNSFTISSLPWVNFTGFNINVFNEGSYLPPIFTIGKFIEIDNKILMPLSIQVHHAVCDGFHMGRFIQSLQDISTNYKEWLL
ncbi:MAG: chloramphenicol acetyltransferase [Bacteroides sp.]|nr:chloramphenicol acetyltransferase [Bacteroides sp.]